MGPLARLPIPRPHGKGSPYLLHLLLAHAKLVVAKQKGPDVLADVVLHASVVNLPQQLQLLVVLRDQGAETVQSLQSPQGEPGLGTDWVTTEAQGGPALGSRTPPPHIRAGWDLLHPPPSREEAKPREVQRFAQGCGVMGEQNGLPTQRPSQGNPQPPLSESPP